jgi:hypothetical protein
VTALGESLRDVLEPVRDVYVAELLEILAQELSRGGEVEPEPMLRDVDGRLRRGGPLGLPSRGDFRVTRDGRTLPRRVGGGAAVWFEPIACAIDDVATLRIAPFCWCSAEVRALRGAGGPNWAPVRRWFLEAALPRFGEESPDLLGVVHRLEGPVEEAGGWRFTVDLGSASVSGFAAMLEAFAQSGCPEIRVGETEDVAR